MNPRWPAVPFFEEERRAVHFRSSMESRPMATIATRIGPADHGRAMTLEEFLEAEVEEGYRYELARGVLEVTNLPNDPHGQVVYNIYRVVVRYDTEHPGVILRSGGGNEFQLLLPGMPSGRNPDFSIALRGAPRNYRRRRDPVLVAEIVSEGSGDRDYRLKREEYLAYGLLEYWIIDLVERKLTLLIRDGDIWVEQVLRGDQPIASLVLPGLAATVADLWLDLEEYEDDAPTE
jgi:Uma2 family endonuclease